MGRLLDLAAREASASARQRVALVAAAAAERAAHRADVDWAAWHVLSGQMYPQKDLSVTGRGNVRAFYRAWSLGGR